MAHHCREVGNLAAVHIRRGEIYIAQGGRFIRANEVVGIASEA